MSAADHIEQIHEQGWTRVDTAPGEWVALVPNENNSAFGGTLWKGFYEPVFRGCIVFYVDFNVYVVTLNGDIQGIFGFTLLVGELIAIAKFRHVRSLFAFYAAWIVNNTFYSIVVDDAELSTVDD